MKNIPVQKLARVALLIALEIVLSRFLSISTPFVKIGFAFVPAAVCAALYGPVWAGAACGMADFLGANLFPIGPYHPGFTLTAALSGVVFGLLLRGDRGGRWRNILLAVGIKGMVLSLALNTLWICQLYPSKYTYFALLPLRAAQCLLEMPVQAAVIRVLKTRRLQELLTRGAHA